MCVHTVNRYKSWKRDGGFGRWRIEPAGSGIGRTPREQKSSVSVRAVQPSLSTMHQRMYDLCALLNPILVDSANLVQDQRLFRARDQATSRLSSY